MKSTNNNDDFEQISNTLLSMQTFFEFVKFL